LNNSKINVIRSCKFSPNIYLIKFLRKGHTMTQTKSEAKSTLASSAFQELPLGAVKPKGWLLEQLRLQADGQTGHLEELWPDVGPNSAWLGGTGEDWERGPYYLDGLVPLAHLLQDQRLLAKQQRWIEALLNSQRDNGDFGPITNEDWWPRMVALKVLSQHADATGDERVIAFMTRYFRYQLAALPSRPLYEWGQVRGGDNVLSVYWLFEKTKETWLLELAGLLLQQTADWGDYLTKHLITEPATSFDHMTHCVNVAMGLKLPALRYLLEHDKGQLEITQAALKNLDHHHGLVHGIFSGDEWLAGTQPHHGVETCEVVEYMFSLEHMLRVFGEGSFGDRLERVAYNALPACCTADMTAHQYHHQANQVLVSVDTRDWTLSSDDANTFGLEPHFGCCTANMHQGWPKLVRAMWMKTRDEGLDEGLATLVYGPCEVQTRVNGQRVSLDVETTYPFEETITIKIQPETPTRFPLELRIPGWCQEPVLTLNGAAISFLVNERGFVKLHRMWQTDDTLTLHFPMTLQAIPRAKGALGLALGPLVLAISVPEIWERIADTPKFENATRFGDWEVRPRKSWNYGLQLDSENPAATCKVERHELGELPWDCESAPVKVWAKGARIKAWGLELASAGPVPESPVLTTLPMDPVLLVPFGCSRLRVAEFPRVEPAIKH
jgi:Beta-L-arabinofuranosidase, GH127